MGTHVFYGKVSKKEIAYIRFIFEGYENVGNIRTLDAVKGYIEMIISSDYLDLFHYIVKELEKEIGLEMINKPEGYESLADLPPSPWGEERTKYS